MEDTEIRIGESGGEKQKRADRAEKWKVRAKRSAEKGEFLQILVHLFITALFCKFKFWLLRLLYHFFHSES
jgi:hypothetical protein